MLSQHGTLVSWSRFPEGLDGVGTIIDRVQVLIAAGAATVCKAPLQQVVGRYVCLSSALMQLVPQCADVARFVAGEVQGPFSHTDRESHIQFHEETSSTWMSIPGAYIVHERRRTCDLPGHATGLLGRVERPVSSQCALEGGRLQLKGHTVLANVWNGMAREDVQHSRWRCRKCGATHRPRIV